MRRGWLLLMAATLTVAACGGGGQQARTSDTSVPVSAENFSARGPYAVGATRLAIDAQHPVEVFYPADRDAVPANAVGYRYTPEDVWGEQAASFPPDVVWTVETPDAWFDIPASTHGPFASPEDPTEVWYFETVVDGDEHVAVRQLTITGDGERHAYSAEHLEDEWGFLTDQPLQPGEAEGLEPISADAFESAWT